MATADKGSATQTQAIPSLNVQEFQKLPPDPNRIQGKKRFFLMFLPILVILISLVITLLFMGLVARGGSSPIYSTIIGLGIAFAATGIMFTLSYIASVIILYFWIAKTKYGFNKGLWFLPVGTGVLSFFPNVYPLARAYQRTFANYMTVVLLGFALTLVWVLLLKGYLKLKKKTF